MALEQSGIYDWLTTNRGGFSDLVHHLRLDRSLAAMVLESAIQKTWVRWEFTPSGEDRLRWVGPDREKWDVADAAQAWHWLHLGDKLREAGPSPIPKPGGPQNFRRLWHTGAAIAKDLVPMVVKHVPCSGRILDVAGGSGVFSWHLARHGYHPILMDLPAVVEVTRAMRPELPALGVEFVGYDVLEPADSPPSPLWAPLAGAVCIRFLDGLSLAEIAHVLKRLHRWLAPGGWLVIAGLLRSIENTAASLFGIELYLDGAETTFTADSLLDLAKASGFATPTHLAAVERLASFPEYGVMFLQKPSPLDD